MCRLFGFHSSHGESAAEPLLESENSLLRQSQEHRDGWGMAYFHEGMPHIFKSTTRAEDDVDFRRLADRVNAATVITHLRRATQGEISALNCHPFQFGPWVFAHNGDLPNWMSIKDKLYQTIAPKILARVYGSTDSEVYFALFLTALLEADALLTPELPIAIYAHALRKAHSQIASVYEVSPSDKPYALNVLISNGHSLLAFRQGHGLYYRRINDGIMVCSEPLDTYSGFEAVQENQMLGLDKNFVFYENL